jgi:transcriptional regulator with XRE-family HTH domain
MAIMLPIILNSPSEAMRSVALRAKRARLEQNLTQEGLASRAGVSLGTLKNFETAGKASFETIVKIAFALGAEAEIETLFPSRPITSIDDVIEAAPRKRGRRI